LQASPTQSIETDKNVRERRDDHKVECGNVEDAEGLRTDSPTANVDARNLVFSWRAGKLAKVRSTDITSAHLQGEPVGRVILYCNPKSGVPE
jgi:hypothetical protein